VDRAGKETPAIDAPGDYRDVSFSPDGRRFAFDITEGQTNGDIWIRDLVRGVSTRFTFDPAVELAPLWSRDGRRIVFSSRAKGHADLYAKDASGTREAEVLLASEHDKFASDWSPDGKYLAYSEQTGNGYDVLALPLGGEGKPVPIATTSFVELWARFSPDGRYVAYQSNESGRTQVYVQEFPEPRNKWQVSTDGGGEPYWRADGKELLYRSRQRVMAVPVTTGETLTLGTPQALFEARFANVQIRGHFQPTADASRFLVLAPLGGEAIKPASVVLNWQSAIR
jgi:Tol biopolymer transport system component